LPAEADLEVCDLPWETAERCVAVSEALELPLAGIDLKITPDGDVFCFEVNPCPGFSYYEANTAQPIAMAIAEYLSKE
jgi:glutathione synthase/RimK-type ligase-like ATP-grasp enzyme